RKALSPFERVKRLMALHSPNWWASLVTNSAVHNFSNSDIPIDVSRLLSYGPKFVFAAFPSAALKSIPYSVSHRFDTTGRLKRGTSALTRVVQFAAQFKDMKPNPL